MVGNQSPRVRRPRGYPVGMGSGRNPLTVFLVPPGHSPGVMDRRGTPESVEHQLGDILATVASPIAELVLGVPRKKRPATTQPGWPNWGQSTRMPQLAMMAVAAWTCSAVGSSVPSMGSALPMAANLDSAGW